MKTRILGLLMAGLLAWLPTASAEHLLMARSVQPFPEAMSTLQERISAHGYTVSRVQRVDIGLTKMGYKTDKYRVVFFGKADEVKALIAKYPELGAYLPLKIAIFAEEQESLLISADPVEIYDFVDAPEVKAARERWSAAISAIFDEMRAIE
jgi:uncharacterized protein (DUF302 family)